MQEKYGFVYIWRDKKHNRYYIGSHWGTENDGYVCSSRWMRNAYNRRPLDFKRRIISKVYSNKKDLLNKEFDWLSLVSEQEIANKKYYNRTKHKNGHWCAEDYEKDVKTRISQKTKEAMARPEVKEKCKKGLEIRNCRSSDLDVRAKRSRSMKATMASKFPVENRFTKLSVEARKQYYSNKAKANWSKPGFKEKTGKSISESLKASKEHRSQLISQTKWYNNGLINIRRKEHPGEAWSLGRLK